MQCLLIVSCTSAQCCLEVRQAQGSPRILVRSFHHCIVFHGVHIQLLSICQSMAPWLMMMSVCLWVRIVPVPTGNKPRSGIVGLELI